MDWIFDPAPVELRDLFTNKDIREGKFYIMYNNKTPYKTLQELFADENRWTKGASARYTNFVDATTVVDIDNQDANCWCISGGMYLIYSSKLDSLGWSKLVHRVQDYLGRKFDNIGIAFCNDNLMSIKDVQDLSKELDI